MQLVINGQPKEISNANTIREIVSLYAKNSKHLIAELNGAIIPTERWESTTLKQGDALELVAFVGGG